MIVIHEGKRYQLSDENPFVRIIVLLLEHIIDWEVRHGRI